MLIIAFISAVWALATTFQLGRLLDRQSKRIDLLEAEIQSFRRASAGE